MEPMFERFPEVDIALMPVVHTCPAEGSLVEREAQRADEVEAGLGGEAEAGDVAGIWWDLGLMECDVEHLSGWGL